MNFGNKKASRSTGGFFEKILFKSKTTRNETNF